MKKFVIQNLSKKDFEMLRPRCALKTYEIEPIVDDTEKILTGDLLSWMVDWDIRIDDQLHYLAADWDLFYWPVVWWYGVEFFLSSW